MKLHRLPGSGQECRATIYESSPSSGGNSVEELGSWDFGIAQDALIIASIPNHLHPVHMAVSGCNAEILRSSYLNLHLSIDMSHQNGQHSKSQQMPDPNNDLVPAKLDDGRYLIHSSRVNWAYLSLSSITKQLSSTDNQFQAKWDVKADNSDMCATQDGCYTLSKKLKHGHRRFLCGKYGGLFTSKSECSLNIFQFADTIVMSTPNNFVGHNYNAPGGSQNYRSADQFVFTKA
jgi:hypothetical protein